MPDFVPEVSRFSHRTSRGIRKKIRSLLTEIARVFARKQLRNDLMQGPTFRRLEPRRVLNASFLLDADALTLNSFDAGENLDISFANNVSIDGADVDAYIFDLSANTWETDPLIVGDGIEVVGTQLRVAQSLFTTPLTTTLDIVVSDTDSNGPNVVISTSLATFGGDFRVSTLGNINSLLGASIITTGDIEGEASGDAVLSGAVVSLAGSIDTSGFDTVAAVADSAVASDAGEMCYVLVKLTDGEETERVWVDVRSIDGETVKGTVNDSPEWLKGINEGDAISVAISKVDDWMYDKPDGESIGGFSLNVANQ